jgi:hypothetical protein
MPPVNGRYSYRVKADGYSPSGVQSIKFEEGEFEVNFELKPEKPNPDAARRAEMDKARNERLAKVEPEFAKTYFLTNGEVLKYIAVPLDDELRNRWYESLYDQKMNPNLFLNMMFVKWEEGRPRWHAANVGTNKGSPIALTNVLSSLGVARSQFVQGDESLLNRGLDGDFVFDVNATPVEIASSLERVLQSEWKLPIQLRFRTVNQDVFVAKGEWKVEAVAPEFPEVQIYGSYINKNSGSGGASGDLEEFLRGVGSWIATPVINEVKTPPSAEISWRYQQKSPFTKADELGAHDPDSVINNLQPQTGLTFTRETRKVRMLFVEVDGKEGAE